MKTATARRKADETYRNCDDGSTVNKPSLEPIITAWQTARDKVAQARHEEEKLAAHIKAAFGVATYLQAGDVLLSYKQTTKKEHVVAEATFRVLRVVEDDR